MTAASDESAAAIETEIGDARAELGAVLDAIERRLAPREWVERGVDMLKDSLSDGGAVAEALRSHPVPLALIAAGAGWLLVEATSGRSSAELARELRGRLPLAGHSPEAAGSIAAADEPVASYAYARTKPVVGAIARTRERYRGAIAANPLALGMIGMLAGAALAMLLPRGAVEGRWLGTADTAAPTPVPPGGPSLSEPGSLSPG